MTANIAPSAPCNSDNTDLIVGLVPITGLPIRPQPSSVTIEQSAVDLPESWRHLGAAATTVVADAASARRGYEGRRHPE